MKVGDYVRTPYGIRKVKSIAKHDKYQDDGFYVEDRFIVCGKEAMKKIKSSPNITDLIKPNDLLYIDIDNGYDGGIIVPRIPETQAELNKYIEQFENGALILKGVITHEQLQNNAYWLGE